MKTVDDRRGYPGWWTEAERQRVHDGEWTWADALAAAQERTGQALMVRAGVVDAVPQLNGYAPFPIVVDYPRHMRPAQRPHHGVSERVTALSTYKPPRSRQPRWLQIVKGFLAGVVGWGSVIVVAVLCRRMAP